MSNKRLRKLSGAVLGGLLIGGGMAGFGASSADASLTLDLAFNPASTTNGGWSGGNTMTLSSANVRTNATDGLKDIEIDVFATVTGTTATQGFSYAFYNVVTSQTAGGVVTAGPVQSLPYDYSTGIPPLSGGMSWSQPVPGVSDAGSAPGTFKYLSGTGLMDIGATAAAPANDATDSNIIARAPKYTWISGTGKATVKNTAASPSIYSTQNLGSGTATSYTWQIGTLYFNVAALNAAATGSSKTSVSIQLPSILNGSPPAAQWYENPTILDGSNAATTSTPNNFFAGTSVNFVVNAAPVSNSSVSLAAGTGSGTQTVAVTGSNHNYRSNVLTLTAPANSGSVNISSSTGTMSEGPVFVAAWMSQQSAGQIAALVSELQAAGGTVLTSGADFNNISGMYAATAGGNPNAIFEFAGGTSMPGHFDWNFANDPGVQITKLAVVPEPASIGLLGLGAVSLLARRRRRA